MTGPEILTITGAAAALAVTPGPETILTIRLSSLRRRAGLVYALGTATGTVIWMVLALTGVSALLTVYPAAVQVLKIVGGLYLCFLGVLAARQAVLLRRSPSASTPSAQSSAPGAATSAQSSASVQSASAHSAASASVQSASAHSAASASGAAASAQSSASAAEPNGDVVAGPVSEIATAMESNSWGHLRSIVSYRRGILSSLSNPKVGLFFLAILPTLVPASPTGVDYALLIAVVLGVLLAYQIVLALTASLAASAMAHRSADFFIEAASAVILLIIGIAVIVIPI
ncbi:LysE family translocator [Brevibacterium sp. SMBL_HHYL_HB1]|uniref:LysE family translocator n=1 Tax=Brevibacterium sp. SMBL_HHYL_HB1 TaxID=2777556 RepID=UPI002012F4A3|nr:LysE family translocator [Brevibacterium sp. SMBL_HHYL_HB1]